MNADQQFHRVTYGTSRQRAVVAQVIREVVSSVNKHCRGTLEGGFANSLVTILARIVAQCLIDIISGFKSQCYRSEDEWRIVCRPNIRLASAASGLEDDAFRLYIKGGHTHHVELAAHQQRPILSAHPSRVLPFREVYVSPNSAPDERQQIRSMLDEAGHPEIPIVALAGTVPSL